MNIWQLTPLRARINQDGAGSATAFGAVVGGRWCLQSFVLGWSNAVNSNTIGLYEMDSTNSAAFFQFQTSATSGFRACYFGEIGIQASSSYTSRLAFVTNAAGTWTAMFSGYSTGQ